MKYFLNKEVDRINLDESGIFSFRWINKEQDVCFDIDGCGQPEFAEE